MAGEPQPTVPVVTVERFLTATWLAAARATIRPSTYSSYAMHVRCYLVPAFGPLALADLSAPVINALCGWHGRAPLSAASGRRIHATLHRALRDGVRWQLIGRNQATAADPPRAPRPEITVWTPAELRAFLQAVAGHRLYPLSLFYVLTGVRRGEALALRWADLDLAGAAAAIRRSLIPVDHRLVFGEPKTARGRRLIGLDPERVSRWFAQAVQASGAPPARLHDLRHLHATLALAAGVAPRVLADRLGHSSTAVTTDIYQHVLPSLDHDAAQRVAAFVFVDGPPGPAPKPA